MKILGLNWYCNVQIETNREKPRKHTLVLNWGCDYRDVLKPSTSVWVPTYTKYLLNYNLITR